MKFSALAIDGAWKISLDLHRDARGFFARSYCAQEFAQHGIHEHFVQSNLSYNTAKHTLRGMHYQSAEAPESKIVRCLRGAVYDVLIDLRPASPSYKHWVGIALDDENRDSVYIPPGVAHGFLTLTDHSELLYMMGGTYVAEAAHGVRYNDPAFGVEWPATPAVISDRDRTYPNYGSL